MTLPAMRRQPERGSTAPMKIGADRGESSPAFITDMPGHQTSQPSHFTQTSHLRPPTSDPTNLQHPHHKSGDTTLSVTCPKC